MRDLTSAMLTWVGLRRKPVGLLCEILYDTPVRVWTGRGNISWDSKTWQGIGMLGGLSAIEERQGIRAGTVELTLNGVPSEMLAAALSDTSAGADVTIWKAGFTGAWGSWSVIGDPEEIVWGEADVHEIIEGDRFSTVKLHVETPQARMTARKVLRYTPADQRRLFPGDTGLDDAANVANKTLHWPAPEPSRSTRPRSGGGAVDDTLGHQGGPIWEY